MHWFDAKPAPLVLVVGPESYLASKAIRLIREALRGEFAELEVSEIPEGEYSAGSLFDYASPSLFAESSFDCLSEKTRFDLHVRYSPRTCSAS